MKTHTTARTPGFTILEMLAAIAVLSILMMIIFGIFNQVSRAWLQGENRTETFQQARLALDNICREVEGAIAGTNPVSGKAVTFLNIHPAAGMAFGLTGGRSVVTSGTNDALFFIAPDSTSVTDTSCDLTEFGYVPVFCNGDATTLWAMKAGYYGLLRHYERYFTVPGGATANTLWDFFKFPASWWKGVNGVGAAISDTSKTPLLDNVLRFNVMFEDTNTVAGTLLPNWTDAGRVPRAVHIYLSVMDRRTAARLVAINGTTSLSDTDLGNIPYNMTALSANVKSTLMGTVRTFSRTVYLRNSP